MGDGVLLPQDWSALVLFEVKIMIYTSNTKKALKVCFEVHKNQVDRNGIPYVFHPFHIADQMSDEVTTIVALLHDVVEDGGYTFNDLREVGFSEEVIGALVALTHDKSIPYLEYVWNIRKNTIAAAVKKADLQHNKDLTRLGVVTEKDKARVLKYKMAEAILGEHRRERDGVFRVSLPLDDNELYYLTIFYDEGNPVGYSLDAEYADDVHYDFSAKDADRVKALLPKEESLPEALAEYLKAHNEIEFAALLRDNQISVKSFSFGNPRIFPKRVLMKPDIVLYGYKFSVTGAYGYEYFIKGEHICTVGESFAPDRSFKGMAGWSMSWGYTSYHPNSNLESVQPDDRIVRTPIIDHETQKMVAEYIRVDDKQHILSCDGVEIFIDKQDNITIYRKGNTVVAIRRHAIAPEAPVMELYGERTQAYYAVELGQDISDKIKLLITTFTE